jgi:hypothetical protein
MDLRKVRSLCEMEAGGTALLSRTVADFRINGIEVWVLLPRYQFALKSVKSEVRTVATEQVSVDIGF